MLLAVKVRANIDKILAKCVLSYWKVFHFFCVFRSPRDGGYGHGGCHNDGFSVFGFLAFLLAAANLFMMDERKKRDVNTE